MGIGGGQVGTHQTPSLRLGESPDSLFLAAAAPVMLEACGRNRKNLHKACGTPEPARAQEGCCGLVASLVTGMWPQVGPAELRVILLHCS